MISGVSNWQSGAAGLVILFIIGLFAGWIQPKWNVSQLTKVYLDALKFKDEQIASKDTEIKLLREANERYRVAQVDATKSLATATEVVQANTEVLHAITTGTSMEKQNELAQVEAPSAQ